MSFFVDRKIITYHVSDPFSESFCRDHAVHVVEACGLSDKKFGGDDRALGKERTAVRLVLKRDGLCVCANNDLMLADDVAHANRVNADLIFRALGVALPAKDKECLFTNGLDGVGNGKAVPLGASSLRL